MESCHSPRVYAQTPTYVDLLCADGWERVSESAPPNAHGCRSGAVRVPPTYGSGLRVLSPSYLKLRDTACATHSRHESENEESEDLHSYSSPFFRVVVPNRNRAMSIQSRYYV